MQENEWLMMSVGSTVKTSQSIFNLIAKNDIQKLEKNLVEF